MELRHKILEYSGTKEYDILKADLDERGIDYKLRLLGIINVIQRTAIEYEISDNDPLYPPIARLTKKHHLHEESSLHFSDEEIQNSEWLRITAEEYNYPQPEGNYIPSTYDPASYCPSCGAGKVQTRPFRLRSDFNEEEIQDFFMLRGVSDEVFVKAGVKEIVERAGIEGVEFVYPVMDATGKPRETIYQMKVKTVLAPGLVTKDLERVTCKRDNEETKALKKAGAKLSKPTAKLNYCNRIKYHFPAKTMITFNKSIFTNAGDIVKSEEYFGSGARVERLILVRRRLADIFEQHELKGVKYTPINTTQKTRK